MAAAGLAVSWQRWAIPIVDCGREMYVPWRIAEGDVLYRDLFFVYGPLIPYWHAVLFRVFGVHLDVLYAAGVVVGPAHALVVYALGRRIMSDALAAAAAALVLVECVFHPSIDNLVFPYSFNASYASLLNLTSVWCLLASDRGRRRALVMGAAVFVAASALSRQELGLAAIAFFACHAIVCVRAARERWWTFATAAALVVVLVGAGYGACAWQVGRGRLIDDSLLPRRMLEQMGEFERFTVGTVWEPALVASLVVHAVLCLAGAGALVGLVHVAERRRRGAGALVATLLLLGAVLSPWSAAVIEFAYRGRFHLTNAIVLGTAAVLAARRPSADTWDLRWITIAAALQTWRSPLFGGVSVYSAFYLPAGIVVLCWLLGDGAAALAHVRDRRVWARAATTVVAAWCALVFLVSARIFRGEISERVETERGTLYVAHVIAPVFTGLLDVVRSSTRPGEPVLLLPEDNAAQFLTGRPSVHRYYQLIPGILDADGEREVIASAEREGVRLVSISNQTATDYGATYFGLDFDREIFAWVQSRFRLARRLGNPVHPAGQGPGYMFPAEGYGIDVYLRDE